MGTLLHTKEYSIKWHNRLRFRVLAFFIALSLLVILVTSSVMRVVSEKVTQYIAYEQLSHSRQKVLTELYERTKMAATLVESLSVVALELATKQSVLEQLTPLLIDHPENQHLIAGGGIWPEPYAFDTSRRLSSLFWGRDQTGELIFYNDYNDPSGRGYHREEWYVPARYLQKNNLYWSKSYTDPHSLQSMVTVTAPIVREGKYLGATTIDLKLEGLQELLYQSTKRFNGYAFAVDRNGRLLSFPENMITSKETVDLLETKALPSLTLAELAQEHPEFKVFHLQFSKNTQQLSPRETDIYSLADTLAKESDQINQNEAYKIAESLRSKNSDYRRNEHILKENNHVFYIENDYLLQEPSLAVITTMPATGWHIVTVIPESVASQSSSRFLTTFVISIVVSMLIAIILVWLLLKRAYVRPLEDLTNQLKSNTEDLPYNKHLISTNDRGELGVLAYWFNQRTHELLTSREKVKSLAFYDPLTNLPNRRMLHQYLEKMLSDIRLTDMEGCVMFLDIDHFKHLNDSLGHDVGDKLLIEVSQRIANCLSKETLLARLGGDEFVIVLSNDTTEHSDKRAIPKTVANTVLNSLTAPFLLEGNYYHVTASIGIALFNSQNDDTKNILKHADSAMYHSKASGRNTFCFFEEDMQIQADHRLRIEKDLHSAIKQGQLSLAYQPQVSSEGECCSVESLLRWLHPVEGYISPVEFIAIAEESMLIVSLGDWVIENTCLQIQAWRKEGILFDHVAINISPLQFQQADFVDNILSTLSKYDLPPSSLMIEITEGVIINEPKSVIEKISFLKESGIRVSIDDFGTGYSSLAYLKNLPFDELKIDRSFIQEIENNHSDAVITETIITMANNFGYRVIAEGVETQQQKNILLDKGCHAFQGYFFSEPLTPEDIPIFLKKNKKSISH